MQDVLEELHRIVGDVGFVTDPDQARPMLVDERGLYEGRAAAIVMPQTTMELAHAVRVCSEANIAMVPQGGNTGYCGGATPDESGKQVLFKLSRMNRIRQIDPRGFTMVADAGVVLAAAQCAAAEQNMLLPLSMGSEGTCQLGGTVSTNAGGVAVLRYGTAREMVAGLEVVLPDGRIWSGLKGLRKDNTGYDLKQLFMGAEGTLGIITAVVLRLQPRPKRRLTAWLAIRHIADAVTTLGTLRNRLGDCITSFEYISREALGLVLDMLADARNPLASVDSHYALIELTDFGDGIVLAREFEKVLADSIAAGHIIDAVIAQSVGQCHEFWRLRESIPAAEKRAGGSIKHDISVTIGALDDFINDAIATICANIPDVRLSIYGHVGDGNIHFNVLASELRMAKDFKQANATVVSDLIHTLAVERGGSISAEHGIGKFKRDLLAVTADPVALDLMRQLKATLDPKGLMNPGKVL
ncbi:MAG: FAD-binding oxidoreductase [Proteobacteria bacterium]|nr:MAG: FAD-binding oxidoreductase [Pseudomonadota bacterium]